MKSYLFLPLSFLKFWFFEAPREIIGYFLSLNRAFFQMFALPLFIKTFFKPLKNEYRQGLVGFSRGMGMVIKFFVITADLIMFIPLVCLELLIVILFITFPFMSIWLLFL